MNNYLGNPAINGRKYEYDNNNYGREGSSSTKYYKKSGHQKSPESRYNTHSHTNSSYTERFSHDYEGRGAQSSTSQSQLAAAQSQVMKLEAELSNCRTAKMQAERIVQTLEHDNKILQRRNVEILDVMKTLEQGVEALQREKVTMVSEQEDLRAKLDASEKNAAVLTEQVTYLNERNSTLSKKCVDLLDGSKDCREKAIAYEDELKRIRPRYEEMQAKFGNLDEQNKSFSTRLSMYEMRERIWIREKTEMDERHSMVVANFQKVIADLRLKQEQECARIRAQQKSAPSSSFYNSSGANAQMKAEVDNLEHQIKNLQQLLADLQSHHKAELSRYQQRLIHLEKLADDEMSKKGQQKAPPKNGPQLEFDESILDDDDDEITVLEVTGTAVNGANTTEVIPTTTGETNKTGTAGTEVGEKKENTTNAG